MPETLCRKTLLVALNRSTLLHRDALCRIGESVDIFAEARRATEELWRRIGISKSQLDRAFDVRRAAAGIAKEELEHAARLGFEVITLLDEGYPQSLRELDRPPPVLYVDGRIPPGPSVSIVGSRKSSSYGLEAAELLAAGLARRGLTVVSGLARGIDGRAHECAIATENGLSVAVLGCGLDVDYPRVHAALRRRLARNGAVVSEFPLGTQPLRRNFPVRNRIIAALGLGCLVIQAATRSGSLITARLALELGRQVWAVPGGIFDNLATGTNELIRDGAVPVHEARDVVESLPLMVKQQLDERPQDPEGAPATGREALLLAEFARGEAHGVEELHARCGIAIHQIQALLLRMELEGRVERRAGGRWRRRGAGRA